jgi:hypothetical protein
MKSLSKLSGLSVAVIFLAIVALLFTINVGKADAQQIFNNENGMGVQNSPTSPTVVTIKQAYKITVLRTYHWNNGRGTPAPGTIGLKDASGKMYGPWQASGSPGQGGVPNAYWSTAPNIILPAGTYTVVDSNPATWSQNGNSGGKGFTAINGSPAGPVAPVDDDVKGRVTLPVRK